MLSPEQIRQRAGKLTASRVACLMSGDELKIMNLWRELVGDPSYIEDDLTDIWAVQLGAHTESLNLDWYTKRTGRELTRKGDVVVLPISTWAACTLDGFDSELNIPVEAKHVGGFEPTEAIIARYSAQAHWIMIVTGTRQIVFTIIAGAREPVLETVDYDEEYGAELWKRAVAFWDCVEKLQPPLELTPVAAPVIPVKTYDMSSSNEWGNHAATWAANRDAAKEFDASTKELKRMVPADAIKCHGGGITISRNKAGSLTIREEK